MSSIMNTRRFRGRHKIRIIKRYKKHTYIEHLENGYVGNKKINPKDVKRGDKDITMIRLCWRRKL